MLSSTISGRLQERWLIEKRESRVSWGINRSESKVIIPVPASEHFPSL